MPYWVLHGQTITDLEKATDVRLCSIGKEPHIRVLFAGNEDEYTDLYGSNAEQVFNKFVRGHSVAEVEE